MKTKIEIKTIETKIIAGYVIYLHPVVYFKFVYKSTKELEFLISLN